MRFVLPLLLLWLGPVVVFMLVHDEPFRIEKDALEAADNLPVEVGSRTQDLRQAATVRLSVNDGMQLKSPAAGTVTAIFVRAGDSLSNGTPILSLDGAPVFAQVSGMPIYRDLSAGSSGPDVAALNCLLEALGGATACDDPLFGSKTAAGVRDMQRFFGLKADGMFRAFYASYVGAEGLIVGHVNASVGQRIDSSYAILATPPTIESVSIALDGPPAGMRAEAVNRGILLSDGVDDFPIPGLDVPERLWAGTQQFLASSLDSGRTREEPAGTFTGITVRLGEPIQVGTVPASAVLTDRTGQRCLVSSGSSGSAAPSGFTTLPLNDDTPASSEIGVASVPYEYVGVSVWSMPSSLPKSGEIRCT